MTDAPPPFTPLLVHSACTVADALQERKKALGVTAEELDHRAGIQGGMASKALRPLSPQGRRGLHLSLPSETTPAGDIKVSSTQEYLTEALGLRLVVVDQATADAIGAVPAPRHVPATLRTRNAAARVGKPRCFVVGQLEAMIATTMCRDLFRAAVFNHPYVEECDPLNAEANAILALLCDLYLKIAAAD
ncbi:hypothetical protein [Brevundimonas sp. TWP2-3-4b1]|uniref:hypothetical protein n=1 Tax=Brevundimonas sp. TWP2-3-4b1 TaxID=2804580 RepID=UPI003CED6AA5